VGGVGVEEVGKKRRGFIAEKEKRRRREEKADSVLRSE